MAPKTDSIATIETALYPSLMGLAAVSALVASVWGDWRWAVSSALGSGSAYLYYRLLAWQLRGRARAGRALSALGAVAGLVSRQLACLLVPALCFLAWGTPGVACLAVLVVARHGIFFAAWPRGINGSLV